MKPISKNKRKRGMALITSFVIMCLVAVAAAVFIDSSTVTIRVANREGKEVQTTHLCEAGIQSVLRSLWRPFKSTQVFTALDAATTGASVSSPTNSIAGTVPGVGNFAAGVIKVINQDSYTRIVTVRGVGYLDLNGNGRMDAGEPQKVVDVIATFALARSQVFDYSYFVNNYGWMNGFGVNDLIVNGDMRANGNFDFSGGSPTVNGSVYAASNDKLSPAAAGLLNSIPVKWDNTTYASQQNATDSNRADNEARWRQAYNSSTYGAKGSTQYNQNSDILFDTSGSIVNGGFTGAVAGDASGIKGWTRTNVNSSAVTSTLDTNPTQEVIMPDLSNLGYYQGISSSYVDSKATYADGTANPYYGQGAYMKVWNTTTNSYQTVSSNGQVTGSVTAVGTTAHPIIVHGPVTISQDFVVKGNVSGQGTVYTGRNVHVIGSIRYTNKPNFMGTNQTTIDQANEKADLLGLAARGSVILGDTTTFTNSTPLQYMTPPFTHGRYDDNGTWIPPYNATSTDATGRMLYQSVISDSTLHSLAEGVNQVDAVLYTNFVGGGDIASGGGGVTFNGSIISKDEAMVALSLPMRMNYDSRIKERNLSQKPLIDISLPRSPVMLRSAWQDRGFTWSGQ